MGSSLKNHTLTLPNDLNETTYSLKIGAYYFEDSEGTILIKKGSVTYPNVIDLNFAQMSE